MNKTNIYDALLQDAEMYERKAKAIRAFVDGMGTFPLSEVTDYIRPGPEADGHKISLMPSGLRYKVVEYLKANGPQTSLALAYHFKYDKRKISNLLAYLKNKGFIKKTGGRGGKYVYTP